MNEHYVPSWETMNNPPPLDTGEMNLGTVIMLIMISLILIEFSYLIIKGRSLGDK